MNRLTLTNPSRVAVPLVTLALVALMYVPVIAVTAIDHGGGHVRYALGTSFFLLCLGWLGYSGLRANYRAEVAAEGITLRRLLGARQYRADEVASWAFATPEGPPSQTPPAVHGLLLLRMGDGARFRAEVTAEQAVALTRLLPAAPAQKRF